MMETQGRTILVPAGVAESTRNSISNNPEEEKEVVFNASSILSSLLTKDRDTGTSESRTYGAADQDLQDQDDELRALGISVVDQLSLERDVEAAVSLDPLLFLIIIIFVCFRFCGLIGVAIIKKDK